MQHQITIAQANDLIGRFQANKADILRGDFSEADIFTNSQTFVVASVSSMLAQEGTEGLRIYFGMYGDAETVPSAKRNKIVLILCSSDDEDNDLHLAPLEDGSEVIILNDAMLCPPICSATSQINNL